MNKHKQEMGCASNKHTFISQTNQYRKIIKSVDATLKSADINFFINRKEIAKW